ncbi:MAG: hypothetical protein HQM16_18750 [Deltaproteobacteria bacterium]|nr:hypothetical protein [Deltaproteobacteria bacterium]
MADPSHVAVTRDQRGSVLNPILMGPDSSITQDVSDFAGITNYSTDGFKRKQRVRLPRTGRFFPHALFVPRRQHQEPSLAALGDEENTVSSSSPGFIHRAVMVASDRGTGITGKTKHADQHKIKPIALPEAYQGIKCGRGMTLNVIVDRFEYVAERLVNSPAGRACILNARNNLVRLLIALDDPALFQKFIEKIATNQRTTPYVVVLGMALYQGESKLSLLKTWSDDHGRFAPLKDSLERCRHFIFSDQSRFVSVDTSDWAGIKTIDGIIIDSLIFSLQIEDRRRGNAELREVACLVAERLPEIVNIPKEWEDVAQKYLGDSSREYALWHQAAAHAVALFGVEWLTENFIALAEDDRDHDFLILNLYNGKDGLDFWKRSSRALMTRAGGLVARQAGELLQTVNYLKVLMRQRGMEKTGDEFFRCFIGFLMSRDMVVFLKRRRGIEHIESQLNFFVDHLKKVQVREGTAAGMVVPEDVSVPGRIFEFFGNDLRSIEELAEFIADAVGVRRQVFLNSVLQVKRSNQIYWDEHQVTNLTLTRLSSSVVRGMHPRSVDFEISKHKFTGVDLSGFFKMPLCEDDDDQRDALRLALLQIIRELHKGGPVATAFALLINHHGEDPTRLFPILDKALGLGLRMLTPELFLKTADELDLFLYGLMLMHKEEQL